MIERSPIDDFWDEVFDNLIVDAEPPQKYVKRVTLTTRDGSTFSVSPKDFSAMIEQEKSLPPGQGDIMSARMSLDFNKIKKDVERWSEKFINKFDSTVYPTTPNFPAPVAGEVKPKTRRSKKSDNDQTSSN